MATCPVVGDATITGLHWVVAILGVVVVLGTLWSALVTVVVPRPVPTFITRALFLGLRWVFDRLASPRRSFETRDRIMAAYAPLGLVMLAFTWVVLVMAGFTLIFWGVGIDPLSEAFTTSGSSLLTLGFVRPPGTGRVMLAFAEAAIGLGVVTLMISYLPTIYGAFSRREMLVGMLEVRAGLPPSPAELLLRYHRIGWLDRLPDDLFEPWERWFVDVEETHSTSPALVFFRSTEPGRSWITAAGCVLDTAALVNAVVATPHDARADLMIRTGFFTLRRLADFYGIPYDRDPSPDDPISVTRPEFDAVCAELEQAGIPLRADRDRAWRDFAGWRVNYDSPLVAMCGLVMAPPARWSSDRSTGTRHHAPLVRRKVSPPPRP